MKVVKFNKKKHAPIVEEWLKLRGHPLPTSYPKIGYIFYFEELPITCAFVRKVEGGYGQIDGLTSDPRRSPEDRYMGLDFVIQACINEARRSGISYLISFTKDYNTLLRAERLGFVQQATYSVVTLNLQGIPMPGAD